MKTEISIDDFGRPLSIPLRFSLKGRARKIEGGFRKFKVKENFVSMVPSNRCKGDKVAVLEELEFEDGGKELRLGYYKIVCKEGKRKGDWMWGESALFIPAGDLVKLIEKGREKGIV